MTSANTPQAFYRLKVEDALSYLDQVKLQFAKQPDVYNQFLDIMKEFKSQSIDTPGVISRVSNLFKGHADLIEGFNTFLPPGYKIEVQGNDSVHVTSPNSSTPSTIQTTIINKEPTTNVAATANASIAVSKNQQNPQTTTVVNLGNTGNTVNIQLPTSSNIKLEQGVASMLNALNFVGNLQQNTTSINLPSNNKLFTNTTTTPAPATTPPLNGSTIVLGANNQQQLSQQLRLVETPISRTIIQDTASIINSSNNPTTLAQASTSTTHNVAPNQVEFGHAINYVNKIKNRFQNQPDIYKAFLDILHTYQKQQRNLKDGVTSGQTLSEAEVYAKVAKLFKNQEDLLIEFSQFLPDANAAANANASSITQASLSNATSSTSGAAASSSQAQTSSTLLNETTNITGSKFNLENNNQTQTTSKLSASLNTAIASNQGKGSSQNAQANTPNTVKSTKYSTKQLKSQANQENTSHTQSVSSTSTNKNLISNMTSSKTSINTQNSTNNQQYSSSSTNKTSSNAITNTGSLKRPSSNHQLSAKKQKLALKQSNNNNNNSNSNYNQSTTLSAINTNTNYNLIQIGDSDYINSINEITFFEHVKKALRISEVYKNFLRCIALFNQKIVNRQELINLVEPYLGKFPELYRWFKNYVDDKDDRINETKSQMNKERIDLPPGDNISVEIDYSSCKQYGASYREISAPYSQQLCSGRNLLCKEVLNDTFVSFPCWSEDTTFLTSKKNQYEELLFRTEDERFELDVILETNMSAIRVLESVQKKIMKMSPDDRNKYRLDNCLGGSSEFLHVKAIKRIYGDKAKEFIEGIKRNPAVAVPLVLKRLKAKDEEWREAKKNFEKQWRDQIEKNYLKSLDYCAVPFKQTDQKHLKTRSLLNEIETIYFERQEAKEEGQDVAQTPHLTFKYDDKTILEDAAALIIHHVKRQMGIQKEDKQKIKQIVYHFLPDLFFVPRGALSDDEADDEDEDSTHHNGNSSKKKEKKPARHTDTNKRRLTDVDDRPKDIPEEYKSPEDMYRLFFVDDHWYLFFRYHQILCERLYKIYKHSINYAEQENNDAKRRQKSVADALKLRNKCKIDTTASEYYPTFLDIVRNLLDGSIDSCQYEDTLREMFGIHAYIVFTLDKVVQNCVRQLQFLVQEEACTSLRDYYLDEQKINATGGKVANMQSANTQNLELLYQKKVEAVLQEQNCFKILMYKNSGRLTIELLDTEETQDNINEMNEIEKWSEYIEKYSNDENNQINDDLKEALIANPVFLTRNAHHLKQKTQDDEKKDNNLEIVDNTVCKFDVNSYKIKFEPNTGSFMYRKNSLKNCKKSHHSVSKRMYDSFKKILNKWLKENSIPADSIDDWLIGETLNNPNITTTCNKDCSLKRTPYHVFYKYKTQKLNVNVNNNNNNNNNNNTALTTATMTASLSTASLSSTSSNKSSKIKTEKTMNDNNNSNSSNDNNSTTIKQEINESVESSNK